MDINIKYNNDRFYSLSSYLKKKFRKKVYKVSLDGGFTCPNRDGKISNKGCLFCSDSGSGEFTAQRGKTISEQIDEQLKFIYKKNKDCEVIAYFQNFTNTYGDIKYLKKIYYEALLHKKVIGIAIATRPDCINDEILELLSEINEFFFLWIELGLQTAKDNISKIINRGYSTKCYEDTCKKLSIKKIKFVTHMIIGLPFDTKANIFATVNLINKVNSWGIKIHLLYILKNSNLSRYYEKHPFKIYQKEEYINLVVEIITKLKPEIVIHRLTGDAKKEELLFPLWSVDKRGILNEIQKKLKLKKISQGIYYNKK